jgi:hypothetical protein
MHNKSVAIAGNINIKGLFLTLAKASLSVFIKTSIHALAGT